MRYLIIALLLAGAAWGGEVFKAIDTYDESKYYTVVEGLIIDGYRCLYVPWGYSLSCADGFVYLAETRPTPAEMEEVGNGIPSNY